MIDEENVPYARHVRHVRLRARYYDHPNRDERVKARPQVRITHEGLAYLHRRLGGSAPLRTLLEQTSPATVPATTDAA
jgi:hypothetical protein